MAGGIGPPAQEEKDLVMNDHKNDQEKAGQGQQSDKPAFGQLDQEKDEGRQQEQDEAKKEEFAGQRQQQQGDNQYKRDEDQDRRDR